MPCCPTCHQPLPAERFLIDLTANEVVSADRRVSLSPQQAEVLQTLRDAYPRYASREHIQARIYGVSGGPDGFNWISILILGLRKKLRGMPVAIRSKWGLGYQLEYSTEGLE